MAREDFSRDGRWDHDAERRRAEARQTDDFGQADYSRDYVYDPHRRAGYRADDGRTFRSDEYASDYINDPHRGPAYRRFSHSDRDEGRTDRLPGDGPHDYTRDGDRRSWMGRAGAFFSGAPRRDDDLRDDEVRSQRRRGPSDRVLWAIIVERLEDERRLDLRDVEVIVEDAEVTLNGTVRRKEDKRRIEDVADIDGVRHVQNNLRVRERGFF